VIGTKNDNIPHVREKKRKGGKKAIQTRPNPQKGGGGEKKIDVDCNS